MSWESGSRSAPQVVGLICGVSYQPVLLPFIEPGHSVWKHSGQNLTQITRDHFFPVYDIKIFILNYAGQETRASDK